MSRAVLDIRDTLDKYIEQCTSSTEGLEAFLEGVTAPDSTTAHLLVYYLFIREKINWSVVGALSLRTSHDQSMGIVNDFLPLVFEPSDLLLYRERTVRRLVYIRDGDV